MFQDRQVHSNCRYYFVLTIPQNLFLEYSVLLIVVVDCGNFEIELVEVEVKQMVVVLETERELFEVTDLKDLLD